MTTILPLVALLLQSGQPAPAAPPGKAPPPASTIASPTTTAPFKVLRTITVGGEGGWDYVTFDDESHRLFVPRSTHVMVIDVQSGATVGDIPDTSGVHGVALAPPLGKGFSSNGRSNDVTVIDLKTLKATGTVKVGQNPDAILFEPTTKRVFTFNGTSKDATVIDANDLSVAGTIALGGKPEFAVADGAGHILVNIEDTSELVHIDAKAMKVERRMSLAPGEEPSGLALDALHHRAYSVCANKKMIVVDTEGDKVLASPTIGDGTDGAAFDVTGRFALSSNGEGTMTVVATKDDAFTVMQNLATAARARTMTIDPATRTIYLPTAEFEPAVEKDGAKQRPKMKAGTFKIVVVGPS
jgi:YVTN family beta-propeller protein